MDYESVVDQNIDIVYRTALSYCKNTHDADDIVQNTFTKFLQTDTLFQDDQHIRKWLIRVAINECRNMWKSFWRRNVSSIEDLEQEPQAMQLEQTELLEEILKLPSKYSVVIHLYYYEGYSVREISEMLEISESNVQVRLLRARNKLRNQLEEIWKEKPVKNVYCSGNE
ncbi:MAG: RNA polymerase sigma factor [Lachnospiraceae bacterium]|nr:RNA polymerase sigma factor [Lachnospiraceae bacterium]